MGYLNDKHKIILGSVIVTVCFMSGVFFAKIYQPEAKTLKIYSHAMQDYANGDYQNSYYLFSRVGFLSRLKPYAIYHQSQCAKELGDKKSELKQYKFLSFNYPHNALSLRAKYLTAQALVNENPKKAQKYFKQIIKKYPNTDYAIASEYYSGVIIQNKYKNNSALTFPLSEKNDVEMAYRHYLQKAPQGRLALNAVSNWLAVDKEISKDDYLLMANTYYLFDDYENAKKLLANAELKDSWVLDAKVSYALKNYSRAKYLIQYGLANFSQYTDEKDVYDAVDIYLNMSTSKKNDIDFLFDIAKPKGKDYIWSSKCYHAQSEYQAACFKQLYVNYPNSVYGADAMSNIFLDRISAKDYKNAEKVGKDYLNKFENMTSAPMVMYWLGKIAERNNNYEESSSYYKSTISKYPDTYYAYRAYIAMKHIKSPVLNAYIQPKPVEYPYSNVSKNNVIFKLAELKDYEVLDLITDDEFVKSWIYYEKGDYSHSMLVARDAMEKLNPKPSRDDLRWRLVYPIDFYEDIQKYSGQNDSTLMLALIREESYFNPQAQSAVGARGLMQLMPATAKEISAHNGYGMTSPDDLYKPELNIKIGNAYYSQLRGMLSNRDILAVAAYNGGIGSIVRWQKDLNYNDANDFIEQIPYLETRNYVKKVFRSYWNYLRIYVE